MVKNQKQHDAIKHFSAKFDWGIKDIREIAEWDFRYKILEVKSLKDTPPEYYQRMGFLNSLILSIPPFKNMFRLSLTKLG